jgi:colicin import membrane protein
LLCVLTVTLAMACTTSLWAQTGEANAAQRAALQAERERIEAQFKAQELACRERFAVTACIEDVKQKRREALAGPRAQALALDDIERKERAETRREAVRERQRLLAQRPVPVEALPAPASAPASPPLAAAQPSATAASGSLADRQTAERAQGPASGPRAAAAERAASRRAAAAAQRQQRVAATQARIASREAARLASGKAAEAAASAPR